jgi:hypothetical protein
MRAIEYSKLYPHPCYPGPRPVYVAQPRWADGQRCYVRKGPNGWETAPIHAQGVHWADFSACPVSSASRTRDAAVMAFDYYHGRAVAS